MKKVLIFLLAVMCLTSCSYRTSYTIEYEVSGGITSVTTKVVDDKDIQHYSTFRCIKFERPTEYALIFDCPWWNGKMFNKTIVVSKDPIIIKKVYKHYNGKLIPLKIDENAYINYDPNK